ncbi:hypothetical protein ACSBR2_039409 [Camellia fascicularis]
MSSRDNLSIWMDSLDSVEHVKFRSYGLDSIFPLRKLNIDLLFLRTDTQFSNSSVHVFRFGLQELCSTFEEFEALLECPSRADLVWPTPLTSYPKLLSEIYELPSGKAKACNQNSKLLVITLIDKFIVVPSNGVVSPILVDVAKQVMDERSFIGLVLAETLMGLDEVRASKTAKFGGNPLLLQEDVPYFVLGNRKLPYLINARHPCYGFGPAVYRSFVWHGLRIDSKHVLLGS